MNRSTHRLQPQQVTEQFEALLKAGTEQITMQQLVARLSELGITNRQGRPFSRQAVHKVLKDPRNARGRQLLDQNRQRREIGAYQGLGESHGKTK